MFLTQIMGNKNIVIREENDTNGEKVKRDIRKMDITEGKG